MLIDMHCHTNKGSIDAHIGIDDYIKLLPELGYNGMLVTDHNSYNGYYSHRKHSSDFKVFKGIEYDTCDAGHVIIIMPTKFDTGCLTERGMPIRYIIKLVHSNGGVIGSAHPFDYKLLGMGNIKKWRLLENLDVWSQLDFIEGFNSCGNEITNFLASQLAKYLGIPSTGGSDSHRKDSLGLGGTIINDTPRNEDELIEIIKDASKIKVWKGSSYYDKAISKTHKVIYNVGLFSWYTNNKLKYFLKG